MKKTLFVCLLCLFSILVCQSLYFLRNGFSLKHIQADSSQIFVNCQLDEETKEILKQPFYYLGRGRQCFAFESKDGKYALKCVRTDKFNVPLWTNLFPELHQKKKAKITEKKRLVFESFRIAKEELGNMTGTIALHLGKSKKSDQKITIFDPCGIPHQLPIDRTLFILQHKRPLWSTTFQTSNMQEREQLVDAFVDLVVERAQQGILNSDPNFLPNYGFENGKTYQIDIGDFRKDPNFIYQKALRDSLAPLQSWLAKKDPTMLHYLNHRLDRL